MPQAQPAAGTPEPRTLNPEPWVSQTDPVTGAPGDCAVLLPAGGLCHLGTPARAKMLICAPQKHDNVDTLGAASAENAVRCLTVAVPIALRDLGRFQPWSMGARGQISDFTFQT
jgi:hypothetical protein